MDFIVNHYTIILVIAAFLIFALIGFAVDSTKNKKKKEEDLLTKPNDEVDVNLIKEEPIEQYTEDIIETPITENMPDDQININTDN